MSEKKERKWPAKVKMREKKGKKVEEPIEKVLLEQIKQLSVEIVELKSSLAKLQRATLWPKSKLSGNKWR
jgi:hypothetical protein